MNVQQLVEAGSAPKTKSAPEPDDLYYANMHLYMYRCQLMKSVAVCGRSCAKTADRYILYSTVHVKLF